MNKAIQEYAEAYAVYWAMGEPKEGKERERFVKAQSALEAPAALEDEDGMPVGFSTWYNREFSRRAADTYHLASCELAWRAALAAAPQAPAAPASNRIGQIFNPAPEHSQDAGTVVVAEIMSNGYNGQVLWKGKVPPVGTLLYAAPAAPAAPAVDAREVIRLLCENKMYIAWSYAGKLVAINSQGGFAESQFFGRCAETVFEEVVCAAAISAQAKGGA